MSNNIKDTLKSNETESSEGSIDEKLLDKMVNRMQKKFEKDAQRYRGTERSKALKKEIDKGPSFKLKTANYKDLLGSKDKSNRRLAKIYNFIRFPFGIFTKLFHTFIGDKLQSDLESAEMDMNANQYLAITVAAMFITSLVSTAIIFPLYFFLGLSPIISITLIITFPILVLLYMLVKPGSRAMKLSSEIDKQLPFALRHMAIEVKAGVSLFKTMKSLAVSDYGYVSEGFRKVLSNIDKGMTTEEALERWAEKTRSESLRRMISHIVRALRTGGNLSKVMVTIAEDVTFERKIKIREYISKLNLLSLFLMMAVIVLPVMLTILTAIGSSEVVKDFASMFTIFSPLLLAVIYFVLTPLFLVFFVSVVKAADPE